MLALLRPAVAFLLAMTLVTGIAYPLAMTGLAHLLFPSEAAGSLVRQGDRIVGSRLIGQAFTLPRHFQGRPSAAGYDAATGGAANLSLTSAAYLQDVAARAAGWQALLPDRAVPAELVTASGSGLDPHLSPEAAAYQAPLVAAARGAPLETVLALVTRATEAPLLGFIGAPRVNLLALNLALDAAFPLGDKQAP